MDAHIIREQLFQKYIVSTRRKWNYPWENQTIFIAYINVSVSTILFLFAAGVSKIWSYDDRYGSESLSALQL